MDSGKTLLKVIGLILAIWLLAGCGSAPTAAPAPIDFTGHWEDAASAFSLDLSQSGKQLQGSHEVVAQQGNKIDSLDKSIEGKVNGQVATVTFQSSFAADKGEAQVSSIDENTIFWKITKAPNGEFYLPAQATLVKNKAAAINSSLATPATSGTITGKVHLQAPPTPKMVVYAVDQATGAWAFAETTPTDGEAPFNITVPPGAYQVFGAVDGQPSISVGYSLDSLTLTTVAVAANQTVSDIVVGPPSQFECGNSMGYPAAPDGRFAAVPGPSTDCIAALTPAAANSQPQPAGASRIQFQPNATSWYTNGDLAPMASMRFVLSAMQGQQMNVNLTTEPASNSTTYASLYITAANGAVLTPPSPTLSWTGILPASQDYYIEVRSLSQQNINYQVSVEIPAVSNVPAPAAAPKIAKDQPIRFAVGPLDVTLNGAVISGERDRYSLSMLAGETLDVQISSLEGNAVFSILGPNQVALPGTEEGKDTIQWAVPIPADGAYSILVGSTRGNATYTLKVKVSGR